MSEHCDSVYTSIITRLFHLELLLAENRPDSENHAELRQNSTVQLKTVKDRQRASETDRRSQQSEQQVMAGSTCGLQKQQRS